MYKSQDSTNTELTWTLCIASLQINTNCGLFTAE